MYLGYITLQTFKNISFQIATVMSKGQRMHPVRRAMANVLARLDLMVQSVVNVMKNTLDTQIVKVSF